MLSDLTTARPVNSARPTRARFLVLAFLCALTFILYLDRVCISQAEKSIREELRLSRTQMSFVLMAFTLAYGLFEVPTGHWGDRHGSRAVLTRIAIWWSAFTALTGACLGFVSLVIVRFLFGAGEAGALPNTARVVNHWFPARERGRIQGLIQTAMLLGGAAAPVVAAYLIQSAGWRWAFVLFGLIGVSWAAVFWVWFRDDPGQHPAVNAAELVLIGPVEASSRRHHEPIPWQAALSSPSIWALGLIMTCVSFNSYLYFSWFPTYLQEGRGVQPIEAGQLASLVLAGAAAGTLLGGFLDDLIGRRCRDRTRARRLLGGTAYTLGAAALWVGTESDDPQVTAVCAGLSCLAALSTISTWWSCVAEVSGRHLGALFGLMNGMGVFGAMGSQFFFGAFADWREEQGYTGRDRWDPAFTVVIIVLLLAGFLWTRYTPHPVEPAAEPKPS